MTEWVRMTHESTGGSTLVPHQAVTGYERRGWKAQSEDEKSALTDPAPKADPKPVRSPKVKEDPSSDNENKENS